MTSRMNSYEAHFASITSLIDFGNCAEGVLDPKHTAATARKVA